MSIMLASRRFARVRLHAGPRAGRAPWVRRSIGAPLALILVLTVAPAALAQVVTCSGSDTIILDCNGNNTDDYCDIAQFGTSEDADGDGIPNECDFVTYRRLLCDGFESAVGISIHDDDCDGDGYGWTNPSLSWAIGNQGCPSSSGKALKGVAQTPPGSDFMASEFFRPLENGRMDCGAHQYKFTADLRSEAQLNPRIDWQVMLRDATNDANVILIHVASTQSNFPGVSGAEGGDGRGRVLVRNPAGSPTFINTGHALVANQCFRVEVELDNNAASGLAVKLTVGTQAAVTIARLTATASRIDYLRIEQVANGQAAGGLNRLALDNVAVVQAGPTLDWLDCNGDCVDDDFNQSLGHSDDCNSNGTPDECDNENNCACEGPAVTDSQCIWCNHEHTWGFEVSDPEPFHLGPIHGQRGWVASPEDDTSGSVAPSSLFPGQFEGQQILKLGRIGFGAIAEGVKGPRTRNPMAGDADIEYWEADVILDAQDPDGAVFIAVWDPCNDFTGQPSGDPLTAFDGTPFTAGVQFHTDGGGNREVWLLDGQSPSLWRDQGANRAWTVGLRKHILIRINNLTNDVAYFAGAHTHGFLDPQAMWTIATQNPAAGGDREVVLLNTNSTINAYFDSFKYDRDRDCAHVGLPDSVWLAGGQFPQPCYNLNNNDLPDWCEDCNLNGRLDSDDIALPVSLDCNNNGLPDECDVDPTQPSYGHCGTPPQGGCVPGGEPQFWCVYSRRGGGSFDCNNNLTPDECETDCNQNGLHDDCDIATGTSQDVDQNGVPDECDSPPPASLVSALSRKNCDLPLLPSLVSEPRQGGVSTVRMTFSIPPDCPGSGAVTLGESSCVGGGVLGPYTGNSVVTCAIEGNDLVLSFVPPLENGRRYRLSIGPNVTSIAGQFIEIRALRGDVNSDGQVNAADRSAVVGVWTGTGFTCSTDLSNEGQTDGADRSLVVGAWTGTENCAP